ncbi:hypothetical protein BRC87_04760 [Halobacteriales archaeon QS_4_66_20]|nr:MAG: hypothetical protein BRC87_04760 [Halobacteriales archaeon QS_4_66_20]
MGWFVAGHYRGELDLVVLWKVLNVLIILHYVCSKIDIILTTHVFSFFVWALITLVIVFAEVFFRACAGYTEYKYSWGSTE